MTVLSALFAVLALGCIAVGLPRVKLGQPFGLPLVIGFVVSIALAIFFAWLDAKWRRREWRRLRLGGG